MRARLLALLLGLSGLVLAACSQRETSESAPPAPAALEGDATRGRKLMVQYECARCHDHRFSGEGQETGGAKACLGCHTAIVEGRDDALVRINGRMARARLQEWDEHLLNMRYAPSLKGPATLLRGEWLVAYLRRPHDIRPRLGASMPRLALSEQDARDIVATMQDVEHVEPYFADKAIADFRREVPPLELGRVETGRAIFEDQQCDSCHLYSGVLPTHRDEQNEHDTKGARDKKDAYGKAIGPERSLSKALTLAPDLRHARERLKPSQVVPWLLDPRYHKPDTSMPKLGLSYAQARHLAAFIMDAPLADQPKHEPAARLPVLQRDVFFDEVNREVFSKTCVHCHSEPDLELGDGGPGYSGGFGYIARDVSFASYEAMFGGRRGDDGRFYSLFEPRPDGTPFLVAVLLARQAEEHGEQGPLKGMPLGFPALSPKQIQLVESWIAQGRRR